MIEGQYVETKWVRVILPDYTLYMVIMAPVRYQIWLDLTRYWFEATVIHHYQCFKFGIN